MHLHSISPSWFTTVRRAVAAYRSVPAPAGSASFARFLTNTVVQSPRPAATTS